MKTLRQLNHRRGCNEKALSLFGHPDLILFAFLLFFFSFCGILYWTFHKANKKKFELASRIPLTDEPITGDMTDE
ncbi:MAG: cbb3-type cytochrome c oxidase subunit 3 [Bdellovibrionales bacterium]|nr:cbb3-type cytochrome c oxidase subunit 3 [Bdellovibrionales bacterium]